MALARSIEMNRETRSLSRIGDADCPADQVPAWAVILQSAPGCTEIEPVLPGFTGSGKVMVGRPFTTFPDTSIEVAPNNWEPPGQLTESVGAALLPPHPASDRGIRSQASRYMRRAPQMRSDQTARRACHRNATTTESRARCATAMRDLATRSLTTPCESCPHPRRSQLRSNRAWRSLRHRLCPRASQ